MVITSKKKENKIAKCDEVRNLRLAERRQNLLQKKSSVMGNGRGRLPFYSCGSKEARPEKRKKKTP